METVRNQPISIDDLLRAAYEANASDLHINVGTEPLLRLHGTLQKLNTPILTMDDTERMAQSILSEAQLHKLAEDGEVDLSYEIAQLCRFRVNVFRQRRVINMVFRLLMTKIPSLEGLKLPEVVRDFATKQRGLVLVTGATGSGKSTTLAAIINDINEQQRRHIITLEDPIEYIHPCKQSLVVQREIGTDTESFTSGLRAALRQDPDVILVGEMRDLETIRTAITAAETGHLVLGTLHTPDAPQTIDRIIDVFPTDQQAQIRVQLASVLIGVLAQRLIPTIDGAGRAVALEVLINNAAVANLIRQEKIYQIKSIMQMNRQQGMQSMVASIKQLIASGRVHKDALKMYEMSVGEDV
ncbi:type IV pilus twitching motility protein PilT [Paenibacillus sp. S3N08]|uniref:Type IV pilus twitching motility protein PilT n=2 Tax=Paenibacillus agricola TaxID=2716264 RepID=A0ABX0J669_9BACL|nr:type IV pilus twitching motility protein PilT [Paenibacillus agricola]